MTTPTPNLLAELRAIAWLIRGILWGWIVVRFKARPGARWATWRFWYWPGDCRAMGGE